MERYFGLQVTGLTIVTILIVAVSGVYSAQHGAALMNGSNRINPANAPKAPAAQAGIPQNFAPSNEVGPFIQSVNKRHAALYIGKRQAPTIYVMFDANCTACHFEWQSLQKFIEAGQLRVGFVPVDVINHGSLVQGARILASKDRAAKLRQVEAAFKPADDAGNGPGFHSVKMTGNLGHWAQQVKTNTKWLKRFAYYGVPVTVIPGNGQLGFTHEGLLSPGDLARMVERGDQLAMRHNMASIKGGATLASETARLSAAHDLKLAREKAYLARRAGATENPASVRHDTEMAYSYYQKAAMMGSAQAAYKLALYWGSGKANNAGMNNPVGVKMAVYWFTQAAKMGDAKAAEGLGLMYMTNEGMKQKVPHGMQLAAKWLGLAAQQGRPIAENDLGMLYVYGRGVKRNLKKARHWFEMAAAQGYRRARLNLAYLDGKLGNPRSGTASSAAYVVPTVTGK